MVGSLWTLKQTGRPVLRFIYSLIGLSVVSTPGYADDTAKWYLNSAIGWQQFDTSRQIEDSTVAVFGLERRLTPNWALAVGIMQASADSDNSPAVLDSEISQASLDLLYYFGDGTGFEPYLAGGVGSSTYSTDIDSSSEAQFNIGGGLRYLLNPRWSFRADARYLEGADSSFNDALVSLGLSYSFGRLSRAPTQEVQPRPIQSRESEPRETAVTHEATEVPPGTTYDECLTTSGDCGQGPAEVVLELPEALSMEWVINFAFGSAVVDNHEQQLKAIADLVKSSPDLTIEIAGHTDNVGSTSYNYNLSLSRAQVVRRILMDDYDLQLDQFTILGYGEERPMVSNETEEGRQQNRRAIITIRQQSAPQHQ